MSFKCRESLKSAGGMGSGGICAVHSRELGRLYAHALRDPLRVIWLQGAGDSGCTLSLLQGAPTDLIDTVIAFRKAVDFYPMLRVPASDKALFTLSHALAGQDLLDLLIVEGGAAPLGRDRQAGDPAQLVPFETWVRDLAAVSKMVVTVGTCASRVVSGVTPAGPVLKIPGCPAPPDRVLLTLARLLSDSKSGGPELQGPPALSREVFRPVLRGGGPCDN